MRFRYIIIATILIVIVFFLAWGYNRVIRQDSNIRLESNNIDSSMLDKRLLVFTSNTNVPLKINWGGEGYDLFDLMGVHTQFRPFKYSIGRVPVRDEWNIAMVLFPFSDFVTTVNYITENSGTYMHARISNNARYIVATHVVGESQNIVFFKDPANPPEIVTHSHSIDRWPSINHDGTRILFHSFRGGNPLGDLYLAVRETDSDGWEPHRLTYIHDTEYVWPMLDSSGEWCIYVERPAGSESGWIIIRKFSGLSLTETISPCPDLRDVKFPSITSNANLACWNELIDGIWSVIIWNIEGEVVTIGPPSNPMHPGNGWIQPTISADGQLITFVDDHSEAGSDKIGIYFIETGDVIYLEGAGGNIMFPSITDNFD